jgi:hypothetical protein
VLKVGSGGLVNPHENAFADDGEAVQCLPSAVRAAS